ncbi:MAG: FIST N-terminal domain-containing protein [Thiovulaceae bacterium]|nr:FIST N-terminal domain-containing protein [Sulfurimonadaceae bacterium]
MRTYNIAYTDLATLSTWIKSIDFSGAKSVLVQLFSGIDDKDILKKISMTLQNEIDHVTVIGTSTSGEILDGTMLEESVTISLSLFEKTTLESCIFISDDSYLLGKQVAQTILEEDTKAVIMFADGLKCSGEAILRGFTDIAGQGIVVAGGMAGDNSHFVKTFVMHKDEIHESAVVAVSVNGKEINVSNSYNLSWRPLGISMTITKSEGNRIFEINNQPSIEVYRNYLGDDVVDNLPDSAIEFPLIFEKNNIKVARVMLAADEQSITFGGEIPEGTEVRFGVASAAEFEEGRQALFEQNSSVPVQSMFVYSCVARKAFLDKELELELKPLNNIAPISGFFTYGELYHGKQNCEMLNITTTILGLSESNEIKKINTTQSKDQKRVSLSTTALIHLVEKTISELEQESIEKQNTIAILNQYQKAIDEAYVISKTDPKGKITFVNDFFCQISGYDKDELIGKPHNIVRHPDMPHEAFKNMWETIQAKKVWRGIVKNRHKLGQSYYVDATIFPLLDKDNIITGYVSIRDDITNIKNQKERAEALLNSQDSIVLLTSFINKKTEIKQLNQKFFDIFGFKNIEDFSSKHQCFCDLFIKREGYLYFEQNDKGWLEVLLKEPNKSNLVLMLDKNDQEIIYSVNVKEINLETDNFIISTFTDVTELEHARVAALSAEKAKSAFLATMSHELRTPLNAVIGFSQILMSKNDMPMETVKTFIQKIHLSGKHLLSLVNNILDFSKMESQNMELHKMVVDLNHLMTDTITLVETAANNKKIRIEKHNFVGKNIFADEQLLKQVLINILSNAIKFTPEYKTISLTYKETPKEHILHICDEGVGLTQEQIDVIFKPFTQIKEHQNEAIKGTGLGLAISQKIIELHNGTIEVTSELGKGSCFLIHLPRLKDHK